MAPGLAPGAVIGILGGGQLGRMLALAAATLGYRCCIFDPDPDAPAADVAAMHICAGYDQTDALERLAEVADVITYEFENVPAATVQTLAPRRPVFPDARALAIAQDRLEEKRFVDSLGGACAPYAAVESLHEMEAWLARWNQPAILKTRRMGYDGKGQVHIPSITDAAAAWHTLAPHAVILEARVDFSCEVSVLVVRGRDGSMDHYGPIHNVHEDGVLRHSAFPATLTPTASESACTLARSIALALDYVGVLAIELFMVGDVALFNEMAPRVHNSGHGTIEGCVASQFENHIRAICGLPLGSTESVGHTQMRNLIGDPTSDIPIHLADPHAHIHLYGKKHARPGRKMGHVTWVRR